MVHISAHKKFAYINVCRMAIKYMRIRRLEIRPCVTRPPNM